MNEQDWFELEREYRAVFGSNIPRTMLPANDELAATLVREAITKRDDSVFGQDIPTDSAI
jgi:hypothetical protein